MLKHLYLFLLLTLSMNLAYAQGPAGPDRVICVSGSVQIGMPSECVNCCYQWSPTTGLDNPGIATPTVSGLTTTTYYNVTVSDMTSGDYITDNVTVTVYLPNIQIFEPEYRMHNTLIPDEEKKNPGSQTFVNLDNDDCDAHFDIDDNLVVGGDDDMIKIRVTMNVKLPAARPGDHIPESGDDFAAVVEPIPSSSLIGVRLWKSYDKEMGDYAPGTEFLLRRVGGSDLFEGFLWAEGLRGHTVRQEVKLTARALADAHPACDENYVSITVIDFERITWTGIGNGFTGDGFNNSSTLEPDPQYPSGVTAQRVFAEGKELTGVGKDAKHVTHDEVNLEITLTVPPPKPEHIYLRSFDIDDPSNETQFVDPNDTGASGNYAGETGMFYTDHEDNRSAVQITVAPGAPAPVAAASKAGLFTGGGSAYACGTASVYQTNPITTSDVSVRFKVSLSPGDNYRVAVTHDCKFLNNLRNMDRFDKNRIVDECTSPSSPAGCKEIMAALRSPILTEWRTLHVEYDRMRNPNWIDNSQMKGFFGQFIGGSLRSVTELRLISVLSDPNIPPLDSGLFNSVAPLVDGSLVSGNGRFSRGYVRVGIDDTFSIHRNTVNRVILTSPKNFLADTVMGNIATSLYDSSTHTILRDTLSFRIVDVISEPGSPRKFRFTIDSGLLVDSLHKNGQVKILDGDFINDFTFQIIDSVSFRMTDLKFPITIRDDDAIPYDSTSTHDSVVYSTLIVPVSFDSTNRAFSTAYIDVISDGCGNVENNGVVPFAKNIGIGLDSTLIPDRFTPVLHSDYSLEESRRQSLYYGRNNYWILYVLSAWQYNTRADADPNQEDAYVGLVQSARVSDCRIDKINDCVVLYHESAREAILEYPVIKTEHAMRHEIGHSFGLSHGNAYNPHSDLANPACLPGVSVNEMGIMNQDPREVQNFFIPLHLNLLRSSIRSPGIN